MADTSEPPDTLPQHAGHPVEAGETHRKTGGTSESWIGGAVWLVIIAIETY